jgi:hypothetical protein
MRADFFPNARSGQKNKAEAKTAVSTPAPGFYDYRRRFSSPGSRPHNRSQNPRGNTGDKVPDHRNANCNLQ